MPQAAEKRFSSADEGENPPSDEAVTEDTRRAMLNAMLF